MSDKLPSLAITGATGFVGGHVARILTSSGVHQRLLVRSPPKAPQLENAVVLPFSYANRTASAAALDGVRVLFMVSASESADRLDQHRAFVDSAKAAGVEHIVYTSFVAAAPDATFTLGRDHYATEEYIRAAGIDYTFLRDNFYQDAIVSFVGDDGVIRGPAGDGCCAAVARIDVARAAATILFSPSAHRNVSYDLTGPEALTLTDVARILSETYGTTVTFHNETIPEAYESRKKWGAPDWQNDAWVSTYTAIASGELATVSGDVETLIGRRPLTVDEFLTGR